MTQECGCMVQLISWIMAVILQLLGSDKNIVSHPGNTQMYISFARVINGSVTRFFHTDRYKN